MSRVNTTTLLKPSEVDRIFRYPRGRALRLIKAGKIAHIVLPDGEIRILQTEIERLLTAATSPMQEQQGAAIGG